MAPPRPRAKKGLPGSPSHRKAGAASGSGQRPANRGRQKPQWARLAPVYDVDGPRIRLGVLWFAAALPAIALSTTTTAMLYAVVAGLAARQVAMAWRTEQWQADAAAGVAAVPVLASLLGAGTGVTVLVIAGLAALGIGLAAPSAGLRGSTGHIASAGIMLQATAPVAFAGVSMVAVRSEILIAALLVFVLVSAYEMGDFLVGSGSSNPVEGPMAGGVAVVVTGFPMALLLIEPFDVMGVAMLGVAAVCCPVGQWIASGVLPTPGAHAPALRRMDTLLLLAPLWAIAVNAL